MKTTLSEAEWQAAKDRTDAEAPKRLPHNWWEVAIEPRSPLHGARAYESMGGLSVILSCGLWEPGGWWLHLSCTAPRRVPAYGELCEVKDVFIGRERQAIQVFPPRSKHINIHSHCLHLWSALEEDGDGLPDFGAAGTI